MSEKLTLLLVDDNEDDRAAIRRMLAQQSTRCEIVEATSGAEGLKRARAARPDCILLDYYLPDMTGAEFIDELRHSGGGVRALSVPIALLTGKESDEIAALVFSRGAQDYLVKDGITAPSLMRAIRNAIEKYHIIRELEAQRATAELRARKLEALRDELQATIADLADAQQARERFLAVMSHEMRTPLNAIIGYADLLDMELDGKLSDGQRAHLSRILVGGRHLLDLINDVLDLARADARKLDLDMRAVELRAVLEEIVALLDNQAAEKGIELRLGTPPSESVRVEADLQRLRQILTNLIGNAIKFTEDGAITVSWERGEHGAVRIRVEDTGIGIEPEVLPLVFDDFFQARGELTREKGGSGLGLAIAKRLAQLMGGALEAESILGEGSVFTLVLREASDDSALRTEDVAGQAARLQAHAASRSEAAAAGDASSQVTVVAYGPDAASLAELADHVKEGVRLICTTRADDVPRLARSENASLVVLDIGSSGSVGWRAAYAMQEHPELAHTAVLLLPSIPSQPGVDAAEGLDLGWVSLIPKPFTPEQLTQAVRTAARGREEDSNAYVAMVVDDDPDSRRVAAMFLQDAGVDVREVEDGESALVAMREDPPDVVVLDLMMPVLDGFGVLATMRADPTLARIPVVVLTAKSLSEAERQFLARTAVRVLQKGEYRLTDVAALVLRAAARAPQRDGG